MMWNYNSFMICTTIRGNEHVKMFNPEFTDGPICDTELVVTFRATSAADVGNGILKLL